ncbi:MAG: hypothetical protein JKY65_20660 [Planctomycetes bacterium]|nr:hypothetical protein [Planctomycetota bacterium]
MEAPLPIPNSGDPKAQSPAPEADAPAETAPSKPSSGYLVSPLFDCLNFLYMPLIALVIGIAISHAPFVKTKIYVDGRPLLPHMIFILILTAAHLVLVFVRSHGNGKVFRRHPWRFTLVPLVLGLALYNSLWLSMFVSVVAIWWDLYHSSMQTFGLARLYERKAGNDVEVGRSLDKWLNILLYAGPILGGATLLNHIRLSKFERLGPFFAAIPAKVETLESTLTYGLLAVAIPFLIYYVYSYWRFAQQGHRVSYPKVFLLIVTGVTSIYTWGFNSFGQAFFIMNLFHAWQYFAIVWWVEGGNVKRILRVEGRPYLATAIALTFFVALPLGYGTLVTVIHLTTNNALFCLAMVVTIMHFWYDGFIWSVRKKHV